ncbi:DUF1573 domain-containing protein [Bacteroidota bacterium]
MRYIFEVVVLILFSMITKLYAQPKLEFEGGNTYDWGIVNPGESPLKAEIKIWNRGNDTLLIKNVKPGCGCTTAPLDKNVIPPSEYATLDVSLKISSYTGKINKNIKIETNIKSNPHIYFYLKANVFKPVTFLGKNYFNFGKIEPGKECEKTVKIRNNIDKDIKIVSIKKLPDYCKLNIDKGSVIPAKSEIDFKAIINRNEPGPFSFSIKIQTDQSNEPDLFISGWGQIIEKSK